GAGGALGAAGGPRALPDDQPGAVRRPVRGAAGGAARHRFPDRAQRRGVRRRLERAGANMTAGPPEPGPGGPEPGPRGRPTLRVGQRGDTTATAARVGTTAADRVGLAAYPQVVLVALVVATTGLVYLRYFSGRGFLVATGIAAGGGALIAGIAGARRWRAAVVVALAVAGFVL